MPDSINISYYNQVDEVNITVDGPDVISITINPSTGGGGGSAPSPDASETVKGIIELANQTEAETVDGPVGTLDHVRAITVRSWRWAWNKMLTVAQTISGVWTFSASPLVPTPSSVDDSTKAANTEWVRKNTLSITPAEQAAIPAGETNLFTVTKSIDGSSVTYGAGVRQVDNFAGPSLATLLADSAAWVGDRITLTGDNLAGALGQTAQEFVITNETGTIYKCVSHVTGTTVANGSATWIRTRSRDNLNATTDAALITVLENESGWNVTTNVKVVTTRSVVGSWHRGMDGYFYACINEVAGTNWTWIRIGQPAAVNVDISDATLISEIEAHDFTTTPILVPVATVKGADMQRHYWVTGGTTPNLAVCINKGTANWIKIK